MLHGILASLTDIYICNLTTRVAGARYVNIAFWLSLTSLFNGLSLSRSLSNSLETSLTTLALSTYPWNVQFPSWRNDYRKSLIIAAMACAVRPTNAIIWVYMILTTGWQFRRQPREILLLAIDTLVVGLAAVLCLSALDTWYYGILTFTPLNFITTNLSSVSLFYGSSRWDYYLLQGLPILCGTTLPFALYGIYTNTRLSGFSTLKRMIGLITWTVMIYSLAGHKEWRFIHPLLPLLHILAAIALVDSYNIYGHSASIKHKTGALGFITRIHVGYLLIFALNIPPMLYIMFAHGRAQIDVMHYLRNLESRETRSIGILMPCHSTPWQAYLHRPLLADGSRFWALGCEPPVGVNANEYKDQTDIFYDSPISYLQSRFPPTVNPHFPPSVKPFTLPGQPGADQHDWTHEWPEYLVMFGALLEDTQVAELLRNKGYRTTWHEERGWEGDSRRRGGVVVLKAS